MRDDYYGILEDEDRDRQQQELVSRTQEQENALAIERECREVSWFWRNPA